MSVALPTVLVLTSVVAEPPIDNIWYICQVPLLSKYITKARLSRVTQYLGNEICDIGCGNGELVDYLPMNVHRLVMIDRSPNRRQFVEAQMAKKKINGQFVQADITSEAFCSSMEPFETVVIAALLEHLNSPKIAFKHIFNLLKPNGKIVITTPSLMGGIVHSYASLLYLTNREAALEHHKFYNRRSLKQMLVQQGFVMEYYKRFQVGLNQIAVGRKLPKSDSLFRVV